MLDVAINHIDELKTQMNSIWFKDKYKFYNNDLYYSDFRVDEDTWNRHQFVSLNKEGKVIGYIGYAVTRATHSCSNLAIINFSDDKMTFGRDLGQALTDIFEKFKFNKLNFEVVVGNPIEKSYDKMIAKYGGRVVGTYVNETKLIDGEYYPVKLYEILRENYMLNAHSEIHDKKIPYVYNCNKKILYPPKNFITYNIITDENDKYKNEVQVDECLANEIEELWAMGIKTTGCCCGHGLALGFIEITDECIEQMEKLGYVHYIYDNNCGGVERKDAFVPKTYGHIHNGYSHGFLG